MHTIKIFFKKNEPKVIFYFFEFCDESVPVCEVDET